MPRAQLCRTIADGMDDVTPQNTVNEANEALFVEPANLLPGITLKDRASNCDVMAVGRMWSIFFVTTSAR